MRILIANWSRNISGGTERYLQCLLPGLLLRGHEVAIAYERPVNPEQETIDPPGVSIGMWGTAELGLETAGRAVENWKPDVVYCNGLESGEFEDRLLHICRPVLFAHNYYGTCGTGSKCHSFPQIRPCGRRFGPMCAVLHYPRRCGGLNPLATWRLFRQQARRGALLSDYQAVVVASKHMYQEYLNHGVREQRLHIAHLPVPDSARRGPAPGWKVPQGRILVLARLTNVKGVDYLIAAAGLAAKKLGRITLTIAGDGPEQQRLESLAAKLAVPATFVGWVDPQAKMDLIQHSDLLAVPSLWPEPFGLVGIEVGRMGVPAVAYDVGGISDWLIPGSSGELAPGDPPSVEGLADAIIRALSDPGHYSGLCRGAWETAGRFSLEAHLAKLEPILAGEKPLAHAIDAVPSGIPSHKV